MAINYLTWQSMGNRATVCVMIITDAEVAQVHAANSASMFADRLPPGNWEWKVMSEDLQDAPPVLAAGQVFVVLNTGSLNGRVNVPLVSNWGTNIASP